MPWQPTGIIYPDIELTLTDRLRSLLAQRDESYVVGVFVSNAVPNPRRDRMVIVRRDGSIETDMRDQARVSLQIWATTEQDATDLARLVVALTKTLADGDPILRVVPQSGPTAVADTSGQPLRYVVAEFHTRGVQL